MNFRTHSLIYFVTGIAFMVLETIGAVYTAILVKSLIIPILIWLYVRFTARDWNSFHLAITLALVFSWIGDISLQLSGFREDFFLVGLGSFLIAQLLYLIVFFNTKGPSYLFRRIYPAFPVVLYGVLMLVLLWDGLGDMKIPVTAYGVVILTMLLGAINRKEKVNGQSFQLVLLGTILFIIAESMLAINRFREPFELARIAITGSYITAQYLIAIGCTRQFDLSLKT